MLDVEAMLVYALMLNQDSGGGVARAPNGWWPPRFSAQEISTEWSTPIFTMAGLFVDLQPCNAGVKLFSPRMRRLIDERKASTDRLEWLPVRIAGPGESREYAILHLLDELDVIDRARSVLNRLNGDVIKAHLRADSIGKHGVFTYSNSTGVIVLLTEDVYSAVKTCSGCSFAKLGIG
jgi:hypothetical protein